MFYTKKLLHKNVKSYWILLKKLWEYRITAHDWDETAEKQNRNFDDLSLKKKIPELCCKLDNTESTRTRHADYRSKVPASKRTLETISTYASGK